MSVLAEKSKIVRQNTSNSKTGVLAIANDISRILVQLNEVLYPLTNALPSTGRGHDIDALDVGLGGTGLFTDPSATAGSGDILYVSEASRPATLQESIAQLQSQIVSLKNQVDAMNDIMEYDDTELIAAVAELELKIGQVAEDAYGSGYTLNEDGATNLTHSLSQIIDSIGAFFSDYEGTGLTHEGSYPTIGLIVDGLEETKAFVGFEGDATPDYKGLSGPYNFTDSVSLVQAIVELDNRVFQIAGSEFITPDRFKQDPASGGGTGTVSWLPLLSGSETTMMRGVAISNSLGIQELNFTVAHPVDSRGRQANAFAITIFLSATTSPTSGTNVALTLKGRDYAGSGPLALSNGTPIAGTFKSIENLSAPITVNQLSAMQSSKIILEDPNYGIMPLKIARNPLTGSDDFDGTVQVFGVKIDWFHDE